MLDRFKSFLFGATLFCIYITELLVMLGFPELASAAVFLTPICVLTILSLPTEDLHADLAYLALIAAYGGALPFLFWMVMRDWLCVALCGAAIVALAVIFVIQFRQINVKPPSEEKDRNKP